MAIINSLLDTDYYKLSMWQSALHQFPGVRVKYRFKCRNDVRLAPFLYQINAEIDHLCTLTFTKHELNYLRGNPYLKEDFVDFLSLFRLNRDHIKVTAVGDDIDITVEGAWFLTIPFEVPVLAIVQEVYTRNTFTDVNFTDVTNILLEKAEKATEYGRKLKFKLADFGTRRRFSYDWHREVVRILSKELPKNVFVGTSNVLFAMKFGLKPIGTMAHEYLMVGQGMEDCKLQNSQRYMLEKWVQEYRGDLGIALSDVVGFDAFLRDFDRYFAKLYDGCRHDSGDPFQWGEKLIDHYQKLGINPLTKQAVFSDGLDMDLAYKLANHFHGRINTSFGIGTNLTNDLPGVKPAQIVMKIVEVNGNPVAKISDSTGKGMCEDASFEKYIREVYKIGV